MMQEPTPTQSLLPNAENPDMSYTLVIENDSEKDQTRGGCGFRLFAFLGAITLAAGVLAFGIPMFARGPVEPAQTPQTLSLQEYLSQKKATRPLSREPRSMLFPNMETLGRGYDIFRGDPRSPGVTPDPGILHNYPIFAVGNENTPGVQIVTGERCATTFQSRAIFGMNSYRDALSTSVGVNAGVSGFFGLFGGSFSASHSWNEVRSGSESRRNVLVESTAECSFYTASIVPPTRWARVGRTPLHADFRDALDWLRSILFPSTRDYHDVIDFFGTHAMFNNMRMGSLVGTRSEVSERSFTSHFQDSRQFETSASFSAGMFTFGTDISRSSDRQRTEQFDASSERRVSFTIGTSPLRQSWSSGEVRSNPAPIAFDLLDIATVIDLYSDLPTSGVMDKATVVRGFRNALQRRCSHLRGRGVSVQCGDLSPDRIP